MNFSCFALYTHLIKTNELSTINVISYKCEINRMINTAQTLIFSHQIYLERSDA